MRAVVNEKQMPMFDGLPSHSGDVKALRQVKQLQATIIVPERYVCVQTDAQLDHCIRDIKEAGLFAVDCETNGTHWKATSVGFSITPKLESPHSYFIPTDMQFAKRNFTNGEVRDAFEEVFADESIKKINHNIKFDLHKIRRTYGIEVFNGIFHDTLLAQWLLNENEDHDLESVCRRWLKSESWKIKNDGKFHIWPINVATVYACNDSEQALLLSAFQREHLAKLPAIEALMYHLEMPHLMELYEAERVGIAWDDEYAATIMRPQIEAELAQAEAECRKYVGNINIGSHEQLAAVVFDGLGLPMIDGSRSLDKKVLARLRAKHPVIPAIERHRKYSKAKEAFTDKLPLHLENGRIHASFSGIGARTGRPSCKEPNLQQLPKQALGPIIRRAFVPSSGFVLVSMDFEQAELRVLAHLSQDSALLDIFRTSKDIHKVTMALISHLTEAEIDALPPAEYDTLRVRAKCVHPDTLLRGMDGSAFMIGSLPLGEPEEFRKLGGTIAGPYGLARIRSTYNGGVKPLRAVVTRRGILTCSDNHRFLMADGGLKRAVDIQSGDYLAEPVTVPLPSKSKVSELTIPLWRALPPLRLAANRDLAYIAGVFVGDGSVVENAVHITHGEVGKTDSYGIPYEQWQRSIVESLQMCGFSPNVKNESVYIGSRVAVRLFSELGLAKDDRKTLRVPSWVMEMGRDGVRAFIAGLIDTDGTVNRSGQFSFTTKDYIFAGQVAELARACGLTIYCEPCFNKTYERYYIRVHFAVNDGALMKPFLRHAGKQKRVGRKNTPRVPKPNMVTAVIDVGEMPCVDLEVTSKDHLYVTNGLVTHNTINFGIVYGMGVTKLMDTINFIAKCEENMIDINVARALIDAYFEGYPLVDAYKIKMGKRARRQGFVTTIMGRKRRLPNASSKDRAKSAGAERQAGNAPIQGSVADAIKLAVIRLGRKLCAEHWPYRLLLQVHDELIYEVPKAWLSKHKSTIKVLTGIMAECLPLSVPVIVKADILNRWGDKIDLDAMDFDEEEITA